MKRLPQQTICDPYMDPYLCRVFTATSPAAWGVGTLVGTNNDAHYVPITFPVDCVLYNMQVYMGNTTGNFDLAFYDENLNRIASKGSTAMAVGVQTLTLPEVAVNADKLYYGAVSLSNTAGTILRMPQGVSVYFLAAGCGRQASALPLPDPGVPGAWINAQAPCFVFGVR